MNLLQKQIKRFPGKPTTPEFLRNQACSSTEAERLQHQAYTNINRLIDHNNRRILLGLRPFDFTAEMLRRQGIDVLPRKKPREANLQLIAN